MHFSEPPKQYASAPPVRSKYSCFQQNDSPMIPEAIISASASPPLREPEAPSGCVDLLHQLRSATIDGICNACQDLSVTWLWGKGGVDREEEKIDEAVSALISLQTGAPSRATLSANLRAGAYVEFSSD
ncbi:hypothetical protein DFH09DRAFT_1284822 [Mycena vulgaris]|nr:hypothetical protein DFH09DRAFT_1284822 [Mycena vulgaris]